MKRAFVFAILLLAPLSLSGAKLKAYIDYDQHADFSTFKTFKYYETLETSVEDEAPMTHRLIRALIMKQLHDGGMKRVEEDPDVYVTYHTDTSSGLRMNTTNYMYHYSAGWWVSPYWGSGMDISGYTQGTLIIDIWNAKTNEAVWRGVVVGVLSDTATLEKVEKTVVKALNLLGKEWRKMQKKAK
jgi:hypothetical protein